MKNLSLKSLSDLEALQKLSLSDSDRIDLLKHPSLFICPAEEERLSDDHSTIIDNLLGLEVSRIEKDLLSKAQEINPKGNLETWGASLHDGNQTWVGLAPEVLQTPYSELNHICDLLNPQDQDHFVDLGAGYGRFALVLDQVPLETTFTGLEYVKERVDEGREAFRRLQIKNATLLEQDLTCPEFILPEADFYFIYDYGKILHIRNTINQLAQMGDRKNFKVIARGRGVRSIIDKEHPWLSGVHDPYHEENFSIYSMSL
jgi:SAM-dependent methyltransferase